jgi:hypothetical protein
MGPTIRSSTWWAEEEAGNFVEVRSRGGILTYSKREKKGRSRSLFLNSSISWLTYFTAVLQTGPELTDVHTLPLSYLRVYGNNHSIRGTSSQLFFTPPGEKSLGKNKVASDIFFPGGTDDEHPRPTSEHNFFFLCDRKRRKRCMSDYIPRSYFKSLINFM